jgi:hypothetical protein
MRMTTLGAVGLATIVFAGCGGSGESEAHKQAREDAETEAGYYCSFGFTGSIHSDEFKNCVKDQTKRFLAEWESEHPGE